MWLAGAGVRGKAAGLSLSMTTRQAGGGGAAWTWRVGSGLERGGVWRGPAACSFAAPSTTSRFGGRPPEPSRPPLESTARIAAQTCLQGSPPLKYGQEQEDRSACDSRVRTTLYRLVPETVASAFSGPQAVRLTRRSRK